MLQIKMQELGKLLDKYFLNFSAGPIARALSLGADVVITGRCVDSAMVLAPLIHKVKSFQWQ